MFNEKDKLIVMDDLNLDKEEVDVIDRLLDENDEDPVTLYDEENNETKFEQVAIIPLDEKIYCILKPITKIEGVADDEALVFVIEEIDDEDCLVMVDDDKIINKVFEKYYKLLEEVE